MPEPEEYDEEYDVILRSEEGQAICEVEGVDNGAVDVDKYRQLLDYVEDAASRGQEYRGILVGNAYRLSPPETRPSQFTDHAREGCNRQGYCMLPTTELYKVVCAVLEDPDDEVLRQRARCSILAKVGKYEFT